MADVLLSACGPPETQATALGTHSRSLLELAAFGCSRWGGWSTGLRCGRSGDYGGCSGGETGPDPAEPAGRMTARGTRLVSPRLRGRARNDPQRGEAIPTALKAPARTTVAQSLSRRPRLGRSRRSSRSEEGDEDRRGEGLIAVPAGRTPPAPEGRSPST